jgi:hypothetical protein
VSDFDLTEPPAALALDEVLQPIWAETRGDPGVVVAVIDGPVDLTHETLRGADIVRLGGAEAAGDAATRHGTHVASVIFGQHEGPLHGVAPRCRGVLIPVFRDDAGSGEPTASQAELAAAVRTAIAEGAHVLNISAGELSPEAAVDPALEEAIREAVDAGILVVAAAGEAGCSRPRVPSSLDGVLTVGAVGTAESRSREDEGPCILAPAAAILGAVPQGGLVSASGTSYATAITSGVAALLLSLQVEDGRSPQPSVVRDAILAAGPTLDPRAAAEELRRHWQGPAPSARASRNRRARRVLDALDGVRYVVDPGALALKFGGVRAEDFGTVTIHVSRWSSYRIPDFHYDIGRDHLGMRLIPVSDADDVVLSDGTSVGGADVLDALLRQELALGDDEPIFAIMSYIHPEDHAYDLAGLAKSTKLQLAHRHVGSYLGAGRTTHALSRRHRWRGESALNIELNADQHPANVQVVSLKGAPQPVLNRNAHTVDTIVTAGARVPEDADNIMDCQTLELNTVLQYYRDVIREADYLEDLAWYTNCSVHKMIVVNLALNLPHNPAAFAECFGEDGSALWADFRDRYASVHGEPFSAEHETAFTPLWKLAGLAPETIRPLTLREHLAYRAACQEDRLEEYDGRQPLKPDGGLAWPLENVIDTAAEFIDTYVPFDRAGGVVLAAELLLMAPSATRRIGIDRDTYFRAVTPIAGKVLAAEALRRGALATAWLETSQRDLRLMAGMAASDADHRDTPRDAAVRAFTGAAKQELHELVRHGRPPPFVAAAWLTDALRHARGELRLRTTDPSGRSGRFASPSIFHRIALGRHPKSPFVEMRTVCTVMDQADLVAITSPPPAR